MKKTILGFFTAAFIVAFFSGNLFAQAKAGATGSIGIVDVEAIVKEMPEALAADKEITELSKKYQDSIANKRKDIEGRYQTYLKQKTMLAADKQQQEEEKFGKEVQDLQNYGNEKQQEITQIREKLLEPIRAKVKGAIEAIAKDEKISVVLSRDASSIVLFFEPKLDITFRVIDKIKRDK